MAGDKDKIGSEKGQKDAPVRRDRPQTNQPDRRPPDKPRERNG